MLVRFCIHEFRSRRQVKAADQKPGRRALIRLVRAVGTGYDGLATMAAPLLAKGWCI
jgi:hypothetical protein